MHQDLIFTGMSEVSQGSLGCHREMSQHVATGVSEASQGCVTKDATGFETTVQHAYVRPCMYVHTNTTRTFYDFISAEEKT
jgi:hypothetical protein